MKWHWSEAKCLANHSWVDIQHNNMTLTVILPSFHSSINKKRIFSK